MNATRDIGIIRGLESIANMATTGTGAGAAASFYMAGMAHWAAITDIRTDLANNWPYRDSNGAPGLKGQSVKTFIINVEENASLGVNSQFWYARNTAVPENYDPLDICTFGLVEERHAQLVQIGRLRQSDLPEPGRNRCYALAIQQA